LCVIQSVLTSRETSSVFVHGKLIDLVMLERIIWLAL